eukprot:2221298-Pyramimonas_sp.AAC.1
MGTLQDLLALRRALAPPLSRRPGLLRSRPSASALGAQRQSAHPAQVPERPRLARVAREPLLAHRSQGGHLELAVPLAPPRPLRGHPPRRRLTGHRHRRRAGRRRLLQEAALEAAEGAHAQADGGARGDPLKAPTPHAELRGEYPISEGVGDVENQAPARQRKIQLQQIASSVDLAKGNECSATISPRYHEGRALSGVAVGRGRRQRVGPRDPRAIIASRV